MTAPARGPSAPGLGLAFALVLGGCATHGVQSVLDPAGRHAALTLAIWREMLWVCGAAYVLVLGFFALAALRACRTREAPEPLPGAEEGLHIALWGWIALTGIGLVALAVGSFLVDRRAAAAGEGAEIHVRVTAHQWWWEVEYLDSAPARRFVTANELHLPLSVPARIELRSKDVIHSFWVPNLNGKVDLIPGRDNEIALLPEREGTYRGQCAEFCGLQHAHMAFDVTVESRDAFDAWREAQLAPAAVPSDPRARDGMRQFAASHCVMCHSIRGTPANGRVAPDLTHVASRPSIAAGTLPNRRGYLAAWIADPQTAKPGNHMPYIGLEPARLDALLAYLESLR